MSDHRLAIEDKKPDLDGVASASLTATNASAGTVPSGQGALPSDPSDGVIATAQSSLDSKGLEKPFPQKVRRPNRQKAKGAEAVAKANAKAVAKQQRWQWQRQR